MSSTEIAGVPCPLCGLNALNRLAGPLRRQFLSCSGCGLVFLHADDRLGSRDERSRYLLHNNDLTNTGYRRYLERFVSELSPFLASGDEGLDYGSGPTDALAQLLGARVSGVSTYDPFFSDDPSVLHRTYDFVTCHEVMEHFFTPATALREIDRLVKEGGVIAFRTGILRPELDFGSWWYARDPTHCSFYRAQSMEWIAESMSWDIVFSDADSGLYTYRKPSIG